MNLIAVGSSLLLQLETPESSANTFVDTILSLLQLGVFVLAAIVVIAGLVYLLYPRINPYLRRAGAGRAYVSNAENGMMTVPLRVRKNGVRESDTRRFSQWRENIFGGVNESFPLILNKSIGVVGATGQGKTEFINTLIYQIKHHPSDIPMVVFDVKGEFETFLTDKSRFPNTEVVKLGVDGSTYKYNLLAEASKPRDYREIVKLMFGSSEGDSESNNDFFSSTAIHLVEALMRCYVELDLSSLDVDQTQSTAGFLEFVYQHDVGEIREIIEQHPDSSVAQASEFIDPNSERQQQGVYSSVIDNLKKVFVGNFAGEGHFHDEHYTSIRHFFNNPNGRVLLISQPPDAADSLDLMYRFLLDWAMKLSLSDDYPSYFIYDEFSALPSLAYIDDLVERGRQRNSVGVFGLQDINQIRTAYGRHRGPQIMASLTQQVILGLNSEESTEWAVSQLGSEDVVRKGTKTTDDGEAVEGKFTFKEPIVSAQEFGDWKPGEAAIISAQDDGRHWATGQLAMLPQARDKLNKAIPKLPRITGSGDRVASPMIWDDGGVDRIEIEAAVDRPESDDGSVVDDGASVDGDGDSEASESGVIADCVGGGDNPYGEVSADGGGKIDLSDIELGIEAMSIDCKSEEDDDEQFAEWDLSLPED